MAEIERFNTHISEAVYDHLIMKYDSLENINKAYQAERAKTTKLTSQVDTLQLKLEHEEGKLKSEKTEVAACKQSYNQSMERNKIFMKELATTKQELVTAKKKCTQENNTLLEELELHKRERNSMLNKATEESKAVKRSIEESNESLKQCRSSLAKEMKQKTDKFVKEPEKQRKAQERSGVNVGICRNFVFWLY